MEASLEEGDLKGMEVCNFGGTEVALPLVLIEQVKRFSCFLTLGTQILTILLANRRPLRLEA